ncbi:MAG: LPS-assembly protein LptD [Synechococcaceae cyanobacterium]|nr:LPS-assembly protein LptD [Synechococcaceae cyanobacterium]
MPHPARLRSLRSALPALAGILAGSLILADSPGSLGAPPAPAPAAAPPAPAPPAPAAAAAPAAGPDTGMVTIESDSQQADNVTGIVTATGNVRITYPEKGMVATARQAQYFSREGKLVLRGDVDVIDADGQRIRAETLTYRLDSERIVAEPQAGRQVTSRLKMRQATGQAPSPLLP